MVMTEVAWARLWGARRGRNYACACLAIVTALSLTVSSHGKRLRMQTIEVPGSSPRIVLFGVRKQAECQRALDSLSHELSTFHRSYPQEWTIDVMCTDITWNELCQIADQKKTSTAFTVLSKKQTFVRGDIFNHTRSAYRQTIAHELGHILCKCSSEEIADSFADDIQGYKAGAGDRKVRN